MHTQYMFDSKNPRNFFFLGESEDNRVNFISISDIDAYRSVVMFYLQENVY